MVAVVGAAAELQVVYHFIHVVQIDLNKMGAGTREWMNLESWTTEGRSCGDGGDKAGKRYLPRGTVGARRMNAL